MTTHDDQSAHRARLIRELGLTLDAKFIPWSQSRNKSEKTPSLNWVVTLKRNGRLVIETDYMQGCGHAPSAKNTKLDKYQQRAAETLECETGKHATKSWGSNVSFAPSARHVASPSVEAVLYSLLCDASVIYEGSFEDWAASLGYDTDSRKAESIWRQCIETSLKLRAALGEENLAKLRDAYQDY